MIVSAITPSELVDQVVGLVPATGNGSRVLAVAGGSASGKTTIAQELAQYLPSARVFSQDLFQLGKDFNDRKTSPYKWDDPKNFDLASCAVALATLKRGEAVSAPYFDVVANERVGMVTIEPARWVIWEGVYAFYTEELRRQIDIAIFVDVPYVIRLLRRIKRFFMSRDIAAIDDISTPARQMLTFVWAAEKTFVSVQREMATFCIPFDDKQCQAEITSFVDVVTQRIPEALRLPQPDRNAQSISWHTLRFVLTSRSFEIFANDRCVYTAPVPAELYPAIKANLREIFAL